jgi:hypothetical protein
VVELKLEDNSMKRTMVDSLDEMKENALLSKPDFNSEEYDAKIIIHNKEDAIPIEGMNLVWWCASKGAQIINIEDIRVGSKYYLEFRGAGSYYAIQA